MHKLLTVAESSSLHLNRTTFHFVESKFICIFRLKDFVTCKMIFNNQLIAEIRTVACKTNWKSITI